MVRRIAVQVAGQPAVMRQLLSESAWSVNVIGRDLNGQCGYLRSETTAHLSVAR
jgi:hypothetical protein